MRVLLLGGTPRALYHGGLETQRDETAAALRRLGVELADPDRAGTFDVLHLFGADPSSWHLLQHWRSSAPLVVSPVLVFRRSRPARSEAVLRRIRVLGATSATMRADVVRAADAAVALQEEERAFLREGYGVSDERIVVVPNGSPAESGRRRDEHAFVVAVGVIGPRKNQAALVKAWRSEWPRLVLVGPLEAGWVGAAAFLRDVEAHPDVEHRGVLPRQQVWDLQAAAIATISASTSEGESLALLDSLRLGRPVLLPEGAGGLSARYDDGVLRYASPASLAPVLEAAARRTQPPSAPPSWDEVAERLLGVYQRVVARRSSAPRTRSAGRPAATST